MRRNFLFALITISGLALSATSTQGASIIGGSPSGGQPFPEASSGFVPKLVHDVDSNRLWSAILSALAANSIAIAVSSKEAGQLTTEYIPGQVTSYGPFGLAGVGTSRYRYSFFVIGEGTQTRLNMKVGFESSLSGASGATGFRDIGDRNPQIVEALRNWMYEQIRCGEERITARRRAALG